MLPSMRVVVLVSVVIIYSCQESTARWPRRVGDVNGGTPCAACVFLVGIAEQLTQIHNETIAQSIERFCSYLPSGGFQELCDELVKEYAPGIIRLIEDEATPEVACYGVDLCKHETSEICQLFFPPKHDPPISPELIRWAIKTAVQARGRPYRLPDFCKIPVIKKICDIIERFADNHLPVVDTDGDYYSDVETLRGGFWRGKDCDDLSKEIHPGLKTSGDEFFDSDCNGIYGWDMDTGKTYESQWCSHTPHMGTVILGDSVGAHFHIPPEYITPSQMSISTYKDIMTILENEFDWPMLSAGTGHMNTTPRWDGDISGPVDSLYLKLRSINRCVHRDFQNLCVNGADSSEMKKSIVQSLARKAEVDHPLFINLALLGNDVCNSHLDIDHMTTPQAFYQNNMATLKYLDSRVPHGSIVIAYGLVDGRVLYDSLHDRIHPLGSLRDDVTYAQFYNFLNCLQISPCAGWLNGNATLRNLTTQRAENLSMAMQDLVKNTTYKNFKLYYMDAPVKQVLKTWTENGGQDWQLIEPVDGFHPNQRANYETSKVFWSMLKKQHPEAVPPTNPFNELIEKKFGDQGGY